jgi:photosystem II stability/assembly factor-like uncharacterized protein
MKLYFFIAAAFIGLLYSVTIKAQWTPQVALLPTPNTGAISKSAVDTSVVWTLNIDLTHFNSEGDPIGPMNRFARTTNGGASWIQDTIAGAFGLHPGSITAVDAQTAWVTMQDESHLTSGGIFKTTNGGVTWAKQNTAFTGADGKPTFIYFFDSNNGLVVGERNPSSWEIYTTTNGGTQWDSVPQANIPPKIAGERLREGFESTALHNTFWFCTAGSQGRVFKSTDRGLSWNAVVVGAGYTRVHTVAFQNESVGLVAAFTSNSETTMRTSDGGNTWNPTGSPIYPTPHILAYVPGTDSFYVVTGHDWTFGHVGTAYTRNGGRDWTTVEYRQMGPVTFISPNVGWTDGPLSGVGTIFRWSGTVLPVEEENNFIQPERFSIEQNYPNPFNPSTTIQFQIPNSSFVNLKVYDVLGNEVATLVNEEKATGSYEIQFDSHSGEVRNLSSGIYFYRLHAGSFIETKKMIFIK